MSGSASKGWNVPLTGDQIIKIACALVCLLTASDILLSSLDTTTRLAGILKVLFPVFSGMINFITRGGFPDFIFSVIAYFILIGMVTLVFQTIGRTGWMRIFSIVVCCILLFFMLMNVVLMFTSLWDPQGQADLLFRNAALVWIFNIFLCGVFFWLLDFQHQEGHCTDPTIRRDVIFPQNVIEDPAWKEWHPGLFDYLYLAFTISVTFSPSESMVLTERGKLLMMTESVVSLILIVTIIARAINLI